MKLTQPGWQADESGRWAGQASVACLYFYRESAIDYQLSDYLCSVTPDTPNIHPPIESRTTEQLLEIIETPEQWRDDVVLLTRTELLKRGITSDMQETRRKNRIKRDKRIEVVQANVDGLTLPYQRNNFWQHLY
jgi:hypothetical protein